MTQENTKTGCFRDLGGFLEEVATELGAKECEGEKH